MMSGRGQLRRFECAPAISGLAQTSDISLRHIKRREGPQADSCTATSGISNAAEPPDHDLPARGKSHPINFWYGLRRNFWFGLRRLRWNSFCWAAFLANAATCSSLCRLSFGRVIHSRMIFRRVSWSSMLAVPWLILSGIAGRVPRVTSGRDHSVGLPIAPQ